MAKVEAMSDVQFMTLLIVCLGLVLGVINTVWNLRWDRVRPCYFYIQENVSPKTPWIEVALMNTGHKPVTIFGAYAFERTIGR
jgi:hypothetical protein